MAAPQFLKSFYFYGGMVVIAGTLAVWLKGLLTIFYDYLFVGFQTLPKSLITALAFISSLAIMLLISSFLRNRGGKNLIQISHSASLGVWDFEGVIFEVQVPFRFNPKTNNNLSSFIGEVYIPEVYSCAREDCRADIIPQYAHSVDFMICSRDIEHFKMDKDNEFFTLRQQAVGIIKGEIRGDFDKFKKIYENELKKSTRGKPQNYDLPWNKRKVISKSSSWLE